MGSLQMKKIRYLHFAMNFNLEPYEVHQFRGAVIGAMRDAPDHFHQHRKSDGGFIYRYPLIQYKIINRKPTIVCLEDGADTIHHFFSNTKKPLRIKGEIYDPDIDRIFLNYHLLQVWNQPLPFTINNWLPFNQENHKEYLSLDSQNERTAYMERILRAQIVHFMEEMGNPPDKEVIVFIRKTFTPKSVTYKGMHYKSYRIDFDTNVSLPQYIGLGKAASSGFGVVQRKREKR